VVLVTCVAHRRTRKVIKSRLIIYVVKSASMPSFPIPEESKIVAAFVLNGEAVKSSLFTKNN
jgi:hypothetical protein